MAKTLVGLYDTYADAERVVQDLVDDGFSRGDIRLVSYSTEPRGTTDYTATSTWRTDGDGEDLVHTLTELGVPYDDAHAYQEGVRRGGSLVVVESDDDEADRGMEILNRMHPVDIRERSAQWQTGGWTHTAATPASAAAAAGTTAPTVSDVRHEREHHAGRAIADNEEVTIPVVEEDLSIGKREVERGRVRVHTRVEEHPVEEDVRLREEKVTIERRPVDRPATAADLEDVEDETIELTETAEVPVVGKRARVVEEVVIRKDVDERTETVRGTARRTDIDVDREPDAHPETVRETTIHRTDVPGGKAGVETRDFTFYDPDFRRHYTSAFASSGGTYTDYEPAYRYGYDLGTNEHYRGRDWAAFEADARRDWDKRHPGTWERFKDAIRYGWNSVRNRV